MHMGARTKFGELEPLYPILLVNIINRNTCTINDQIKFELLKYIYIKCKQHQKKILVELKRNLLSTRQYMNAIVFHLLLQTVRKIPGNCVKHILVFTS